MRSKLITIFLLIAFAATAYAMLLPPSVIFGDAIFTARVLPNGDRLLNVTIPVESTSLFSVQYRNCDGLALGTVERNGEVHFSGAKYAPWTTLSRGGSVQLKEYHIEPDTKVGIHLKDWLGRSHAVFHKSLDVDSAWQRIGELPIDD